ncbi:MAG: c-type cytochrome [Acidobacteria bacterium]|nr:c-type cytochrome [Acidobacteriota bacterium]
MMKLAGAFALLLFVTTAALVGQTAAPNPLPWAYGFVTPGPDPVPPPCPVDAKPYTCSRPGKPWVDDGILLELPGSSRKFTIGQIQAHYDPADWHPEDHPQPVPAIVQNGHERDRLRACAHCHYHNGQGKPENGHLTGLPVNYFLQQLALFRSGGRTSADPRKANHAEMTQIARLLTDAEMKAAAAHYSAVRWRPWVKVVESDTAPKTRQSPAGLFIPLETGHEPLGQGFIEVPEFPDRTERLRDPHAGFIAYVPFGAIEKGRSLVTTGGGKTSACAGCHGPTLQGVGDMPAIADRTVSYTVRQLYNYQQGTRHSQLMGPVVAKLSPDEMIAIAAYLASL